MWGCIKHMHLVKILINARRNTIIELIGSTPEFQRTVYTSTPAYLSIPREGLGTWD